MAIGTDEDARFDYVVVGAGTAGCLLADRLSATGASVCVLEAGGRDWSPLIHLPVGYVWNVHTSVMYSRICSTGIPVRRSLTSIWIIRIACPS